MRLKTALRSTIPKFFTTLKALFNIPSTRGLQKVDEESRAHTDIRSPETPTSRVLREDPERLGTDEIVIVRNLHSTTPNLSLNSYDDIKRTELRGLAAFGVFVQLAVITYSALIAYFPNLWFGKGSKRIEGYAFPLVASGTLLLVFGVLLCGHVVESSTTEERYEVSQLPTMQAGVLWLQRETKVSDQSFGSYAIFSKARRTGVSTSSRAFHATEATSENSLGPQDLELEAESSQHGSHQTQKDSQWPLGAKTVVGALVSLCGFLVQFVGMRGMHWSASVVNLGAILWMTAMRAYARRRLVESFSATNLFPLFELDWLSTNLDGPFGPMGSLSGWASHSNSAAEGPLSAPSASEEELPGPAEWTICTWETDVSLDGTSDESSITKPAIPRRKLDDSCGVMMLRRDLAELSRWRGPATVQALNLAHAIETTMNTLLPNPRNFQRFSWVVKVRRTLLKIDELVFHVEWRNGKWHARADELEAALSLWVFSISYHGTPVRQAVSKQGREDDSWLRGRDSRPKLGLRLVGLLDDGLIQDLKWWMPDGLVGFVKAEERVTPSDVEKVSLREVESARVAASGRGRRRLKTPGTGTPSHATINASADKSGRTWWNIEVPEHWEEHSGHGLQHHEVDGSQPPLSECYVATTSTASLENLLAQDMFSAFMWALAGIEEAAVNDKATIRPGEASGLEAWKTFGLKSEHLTRLAHEVSDSGLGSVEDAFQAIIPALSFHDKLPSLEAVAALAQHRGELHEKDRRWKEATDTYLWLLELAKVYEPGAFIYRKALAILLAFERRLARYLRFSDAAFDEAYKTGDLRTQMKTIMDALKFADPVVLDDLQNWPSPVECLQLDMLDPWPINPSEWRANLSTKQVIIPDKSIHLRDIFDSSLLHLASKSAVLVRYWKRKCLPPATNSSPNHDQDIWREVRARYLSVHTALQGWTQAHMHTMTGCVKLLKLLERGADPNVRDVYGWTPLHYVCLKRAGPSGAQYRPGPSGARKLVRFHARVDVQGIDGVTPLHCAVIGGFSALVRFLLSAGAKIDAPDVLGQTPLHYAALHHQECAMEALIRSGADQDRTDCYGRTALHFAARNAAEWSLGMRWSHAQVKDVLGWTPLHVAVIHGQLSMTRTILESAGTTGIVNSPDNAGRTPLHVAAKRGHSKIAAHLLKEGADQSASDALGQLPLHAACTRGHFDTVQTLLSAGNFDNFEAADVLLRKAEPSGKKISNAGLSNGSTLVSGPRGQTSQTAFAMAARAGHVGILKLLIEAAKRRILFEEMMEFSQATDYLLNDIVSSGSTDVMDVIMNSGIDVNAINRYGQSPLYWASLHDLDEAVGTLLGRGADHTWTDYAGQTFLQRACLQGHTKIVLTGLSFLRKTASLSDHYLGRLLHEAIIGGCPDTTEALLLHGADVGARDSTLRTPLHAAARSQSLTVVKTLLRSKAAVDAVDINGRTAVFEAIESDCELQSNTPLQVIEAILDAGCDVNQTDNSDSTPLHLAARQHNNLDIVSYLIDRGSEVHAKNAEDRTALHEAASASDVSTAKTLVHHGASIYAKDCKNRTPLMAAISLQQWGSHSQAAEVIEFLISLDPGQLRLEDERGMTPIHYLAECGNPALLTQILQLQPEDLRLMLGADRRGQTPLHRAALFGIADHLTVLHDHGVPIDLEDDEGKTALFLAAQAGHYEAVRVLARIGANVNSRDHQGRSVLHHVVAPQEAGQISNESNQDELPNSDLDGYWTGLVQHRSSVPGPYDLLGLKPDGLGKRDQSVVPTELNLDELDGLGTRGSLRLGSGDSPSFNQPGLAHEYSQDDLVEELGPPLFNSRQKETDTINGRNPSEYEHPGEAGLKQDIPIRPYVFEATLNPLKSRVRCIQALVLHGADLEASDALGRTPLMAAVQDTCPELVKQLLDSGADATVLDRQGRTLLELAKERDNEALIRTLEGHGSARSSLAICLSSATSPRSDRSE